MEEAAVQVLVLDGHRLTTEGLAKLLRSAPELHVSIDGGPDAEVDPDVVVLPATTVSGLSINDMARVKERFPSAEVVALTSSTDPETVPLWFSTGVRGCLLRDASSSDLLKAVCAAARGEGYVQPRVGVALARSDEVSFGLPTPREMDVLRLIAMGHTNAEISSILGLSVRTVETRRSTLMRKFGAKTRAQLLRSAGISGLPQ